MTNKQKIRELVDRMPDNITFEKALYHMYVLRQVEAGVADMRAGRLIDHDELFDELLKDEKASETAWTEKARNDLRELKARIALDSPRTAVAFLKRLRESANRLRYFPLAGWVVEEPYLPEYREIVFQDYRIIYQVDDAEVVIITVVHGAHPVRRDRLTD